MKNKVLALLLVSLMGLLISGCDFNSCPEDIMAFAKPHQVEVNMDNYVLQPPDEVQVISSKIPEVHEVIQRIRPDGKISFETLGEFYVAGKTPIEVSEMIRQRAMSFYALSGDFPIDVKVTTFASKYYYVLGQVNFPGPKLVTGRDSVLNALAAAQPTVLAWQKRVQVIRPSYDPNNIEPKIFEFDLTKVTKDGNTGKNVLLQKGDVVYVPPTVLAAIAMKIEEFVRPIGRAFSTVNVVQGPQ